ncbi:uncharacterized protein [Rutidosis leptorrhynchoides]|uniref:uncharacterized protein isoform X2 n=1 Tax=Rutidosis leptorrhynchoides TaxID=125765 RepID=UPI003A994BA4
MSNLRAIFRLNHAVYSSSTCCYNRARCRPRLIVSLFNSIQHPNSLKPRLIDSSNVKKMETLSWGGSRNHQRRMLAANWTDEKSPYDTLENMLDKQIAATETDSETGDADSYKPVVLTENMQQDKQVAAAETDEEVESNNNSKIIRKMKIYCSDEIEIDGEPFKRESLVVQDTYEYGSDCVDIREGDSELLLKVQFYCAERAKIQDDFANDKTLIRQKLNEFNSYFRQANQKHALDLMIAAFELEIRSLVDLMMDDVIDIFLKMTEDEAYKVLPVNLRDEYSHKVFKKFNKRVMYHKWAFE